jgi:hypothetical protein
LQFIEAHGYKLSESEQCPVGECVPVKFFIIVLSFIEELEVGQRKLVCQDKTILKGGSDRANGLELHDLNEKLAESLSLVLVILFFFKLSPMVFCDRLLIVTMLRKPWWSSASYLAQFSG